MVDAFFAAIQPAQLNALDAILADQQLEWARLQQHWVERLKRAEYETQFARRQYVAVDPENRLVAAELERRWETQLRELRQVQEEYARFQHTSTLPTLTDEQRTLFAQISTTLPTIWQTEQVTSVQKKQLRRSLIDRVIVQRTAPDRVEVKLVWVSGHYSVQLARPPIHREQDVTGYDQLVVRVEELWRDGLDDDQIATCLSSEGFRSARSSGVSALAVQKIRLARGWYLSLHQSRKAAEVDGYWTPSGLAAELGVERTWVYRRFYRQQIEACYLMRHPQSQIYLIRKDPELLTQLQAILQRRPAVRQSTSTSGANGRDVV